MTEENNSDGLKPSEKLRIVKNVVVIAVAFMFQFMSYHAAANLQSSVNATAGLGTASLASVYAGLVISNVFLPAIIIKWLGAKWAICVSMVVYMPYIVSQMYPTFYTLVPTGFLLGMGSAPLWCSKCTYISAAAEAHSTLSKIPAGTLLVRFLGLFYTIYQMSQVWGNLISSLVLTSGNNTAAVTSVNESMIPIVCGANFLAKTDAGKAFATQPSDKIYMFTYICLTCMVISTVLVALLLDSMKRYEPYRQSNGEKPSGLALLMVTMKQLKEPNQLLLLLLVIFIGQEQAFFGADFSASFVSCAVGTGSVGYVMMTFGLSDAMGCIITGYLVKLFGRLPLVTAAFFMHGALFLLMLLWKPQAGDYYVMFIIAMFWGFCDSIWGVQINAYHGVLFRGNEEAAFANFRLWSSFGYIVSYVLSTYVRTRYKVCLLLCSMTLGVIGYYTVEYRQRSVNIRGNLWMEQDKKNIARKYIRCKS